MAIDEKIKNKIIQLKNIISETEEKIKKEDKKRMCSAAAESLRKHKIKKEIELAVLEEVFDGDVEETTIDFSPVTNSVDMTPANVTARVYFQFDDDEPQELAQMYGEESRFSLEMAHPKPLPIAEDQNTGNQLTFGKAEDHNFISFGHDGKNFKIFTKHVNNE